MLLSYYDSFLSDDIIPENYDVIAEQNENNFHDSNNSPGIFNDYYNGSLNNLSLSDYLFMMDIVKESSLHSKLICMANELNYYGGIECMVMNANVPNLLNYYISQETSYDESDYEIEFAIYGHQSISDVNDSNNHINDVIQLVENGQPVLLFVFNEENTAGHVAIAYDYNRKTNELFCHLGFHTQGDNHKKPQDKGFDFHGGYLAINWNIEHSCSNNYVVNGTSYCYEHKDLIIFDHLCSYTDGIQEFARNDTTGHTKHKKMCHCTNYVEENHTSTCGCYISAHRGSTYSYYSPTQHSYVCTLCGVTAYDPHVAKKDNPDYCITCKSSFDNGFGQIIHSIKPNNRLVTANGSYVGYNGIIYLDDRDVEAYFNGTLVFYNENSSAQIA